MSQVGTSTEPADEMLFARVAGGDAEAFAVFYDRYASVWFGLAWRILEDATEAEDVLQEAAILIWERAPLYDPRQGKPAGWSITVVRNKAIDRLRAGRRRGGAMARLAGNVRAAEGQSEPDPTSPRLATDTAALLRRSLDGLPPDQRRAIELAYFAGLSQSEIAEKLGHPLGTIKARIRRGMLAMRDALERPL